MSKGIYYGLAARADQGRVSFPRTQREAGVEFKQWEGRLAPLRPIVRDVLEGIGLTLFFTAAVTAPYLIELWRK